MKLSDRGEEYQQNCFFILKVEIPPNLNTDKDLF